MSEKPTRWGLAERFIALLAGLFALATAFLGFRTASLSAAKNDAQSSVASQSSSISSLQVTNDQLRKQYASASAQAAALASNVPSSAAASAPLSDGSPSTSAAGSVRHAGTLKVLDDSLRADLDAPASDAQWGRYDDAGSTGPEIGNFNNGYLGTYGEYVVEPKATYESCLVDTGYITTQLLVSVGQNICVRTTDKRIAIVIVTAVSSSEADLDITTYETK